MAVLVRTCCCGCDLKTGILLLAIFGVLAGSFGIYTGFHGVQVLKELKREEKLPTDFKYFKVVMNLEYTSTVKNGLAVLVNLLLVGAYATRNRFLVLPYLFLSVFTLFYTLGVTIFITVVLHFSYVVIGTMLGWVLSIYFIIVVFSFHEALREDPSGALAGYGYGGGVVRMGGPPPYANF